MRKLVTTLLCLLIAGISYSQTYDYKISIDKEGQYHINNELVKKSTIRKVIKKHLKESNSLSIAISLDEHVSYSAVELLRNSYEKYVGEQDIYTLTYTDYQPGNTNENVKYVISGRVVDQLNNPLEYINVVLKGTRTGMVTGKDGMFELRVPKKSKSLVLVGEHYKEVEIPIETLDLLSNTSNLSVTLNPR